MRRFAAITLKQHRFEVLAVAMLLAVVALATLALTAALASLDVERCLDPALGQEATCAALNDQWSGYQVVAMFLRYGTVIVTAVAGLFIGVPLVANDLERTTAMFSWTLAGSRRRWLGERVLVLGGLIAMLAVALGFASDALQQASWPQVPLANSVSEYQFRGWLIPARTIVAFAAGLLAGAIVGRTLPGLLLGMVMSVALLGGLLLVGDAAFKSDPVILDPADRGGIPTDFMLRDPSGEILTFDQAAARMRPEDPRFYTEFSSVSLGIPGARSGATVSSALLSHGIIAVLLLGGTLYVVDRRRPY